MIPGIIFSAVVVLFFVFTVCLTIVPQNEVYIIERNGEYRTTWVTGVHFKIPFVDKIARRISLRERLAEFSVKSVFSKDNVSMRMETAVFYQITEPKRFAYGEKNPIMAIEELSASNLRDLMGEYTYDGIADSRDIIGLKLRDHLDVSVSTLGIRINRVELSNIKNNADQ